MATHQQELSLEDVGRFKRFLIKMAAIRDKFYLGSHHTMERLGVVCAIFAISGVLIVGGGLSASIQKSMKTLGDQAVYTKQFTTSKTGIRGEVAGVYSSHDKTRAMLLFKFDDVAKVSTQASEYQAFITGVSPSGTKEKLKSQPVGGVYVFGNTGYLGLYLYAADSFPSQIINATIRAKSELVVSQVGSTDFADSSFKDHDQFRIFFNPGAREVTMIDGLDKATPDVREIYNEAVIKPQEDKVRKELDDQLKLMQTDLAAINDYTARLTNTVIGTSGVRVIPPAAMTPSQVPAMIASDKVTGKAATETEPSTLTLETKKVMSNGFNFAWRDKRVIDGYFDDIVPEGMDYVTFITQRKLGRNDDTGVAAIEWTLTDGQLLANIDSTNTAYKPVNDIVSSLSSAYSKYFTDKRAYQSTLLPKLLDLEVDLRDVEGNYSTNTDSKAVRTY